MFNSIKTKLASRAYANPNTEQNEHKTAEIHSGQTPKRKRGISTVVAWLIGIGVVVVAGAVVGIILATSASDTQDATSDITARGAATIYNADCEYTGRTIAYISDINPGSGATATAVPSPFPSTGVAAANVSATGAVGSLRVSGNTLDESVYNADFNNDGDTVDIIGTAGSVVFSSTATHAGLITPTANQGLPVVLVGNQWGHLAASPAAIGRLDNNIRLFNNTVDGCWGMVRT